MDFVNETKLQTGWTLGFEPDGRELLVVAVKGTFLIPEDGEESILAETQVPLTEADEFTGEPGFSATCYETDYAHRKPRCDVLLNGSAHVPGGRPTETVTVAMRVGSMTKSFNVLGDRVWDIFQKSSIPTHPSPFTKMPISYDRAFGGVDFVKNQPDKIATYLKNPIGVGYYPLTKGKALVGKPLPNTEEIDHPVKTTDGKYLPMSFGPIGRNYESRIPFAGTYDKEWLENRAPFWPDDFNYLYFQAAPADQQIVYPQGGEPVILKNLSPRGITKFQLPRMSMPILFIRHRGEDLQVNAVIDTVLIEPDEDRFMLTWRTSLPLRWNCFEISEVVVGKMVTKDEEKANSSRPCGGC